MKRFLFLFLFSPTLVLAQDGAAYNASGGVLRADEACYDVQHYDLRLRVDPEARAIDGRLQMQARLTAATRQIGLDLDAALEVTDVDCADRSAEWERQAGRVLVRFAEEVPEGAEVKVTVRYGGEPRQAPNPPWAGGFTWARTPDGKPWIATTCQGEGADLWWPCKDHPSDKPASMDLHITVPAGLVCASNGVLQGVDKDGAEWTWHWHVPSPISNYCVALNIAPYEVVETTYESVAGDEVPVFFYVLPHNADKARKVLPEFLDHLRCFEEICGPYPFRNQKYGIVETPHLGMEHQTIIAYGYRFRREPPGYDWLHNHELSHEWWGNLVTCRDWKDMWIHEGFGTYMQALYLERRHGGHDAYLAFLEKHSRFGNRTPVAPREVRDSKQIYFGMSGNDIYYKGAWVLHALRWLLGDEKFFASLRRFCYPTPASEKVTDGSQVRLVDTRDYIDLVNELAGEDLTWFFDVYLRQPALPELVHEERDGVLHLHWKAPQQLPFPMPVPVRIGDRTVRVPMPGGEGRLPLEGRQYTIDPDHWLLAR